MKLNEKKQHEETRRGERALYDYGHGEQWRSMRLRLAIGFPAPYKIGMSNLGFLWVWHLFNKEDGVRCDRFFFPDDTASDTGYPGMVTTIETGRPLCQYDAVAFSVPYEQDYPRIVWLLRHGGVEPVAEKRQARPLVIAGGVAVSANPEPVGDFFDAVIIGEAEDVIHPLVLSLTEAAAGMKYKDISESLSQINGVYVPSLYEVSYKTDGTIEKISSDKVVHAVRAEKPAEPAHSPVVSDAAALSGMFLLELSRGCPHRCRFCLTRYTGHGFRSANAEGLVAAVERGLTITDRVGLVGTAFAESASADAVCGAVAKAGGKVSFSSIRLTDRTLAVFNKWGKIIDNRTLAIAPEVATARLRRILDKDMEKPLHEFLQGRIPEGVHALKLYYLLGVPGETDADVLAIADEAVRVAEKITSRGVRVSLSVNPLVPKAHTPMQWMAPTMRKIIKQKLYKLKHKIAGKGGITVSGMSSREAEIQTLLSLGDRRLGPVIAEVAERNCSISAWPEALKSNGISTEFYTARPRPESEILPWAMINHGISRERLRVEYAEMIDAIGE